LEKQMQEILEQRRIEAEFIAEAAKAAEMMPVEDADDE